MSLTSDLMRILNFTAADLADNRMGRISPQQAERLRSLHQSSHRGFWIYLLIVGGVIGFFVLRELDAVPSMIFGAWGLAGLIGVCILALIIVPYYRRVENDWKQGRAQMTEGIGRVETTYSRNRFYYLQIGRQRFYIPRAAYDLLKGKTQRRYCVYYTPFTKHVLSIEVIDGK